MLYALISDALFRPREIPANSTIYLPIIANTKALQDQLEAVGRTSIDRSLPSLLEDAGSGSSVTIVPEPIAADILALGTNRESISVFELRDDLSLALVERAPSYDKVIDDIDERVGRSMFGGAGIDFLGGSNDGEIIIGGASGDFIMAREGNNRVFAGSADDGDDLIIAGGGNDVLGGGLGNDIILGGQGQDVIFGGPGDDALYGVDRSAGPNFPNVYSDTIWAGPGSDEVWGANSADILGGGTGNDTIYAEDGDDIVYGGSDAGDDIVYAGYGKDTVYGGGGDDIIFGFQNDDVIFGGAGSDIVDGGTGADTLWGGAGDDFFFNDENWSAGDEDVYAFVPGSGRDVIDGFDVFRDVIWFAEGAESLADVEIVDAGLDLQIRAEDMLVILMDVNAEDLNVDNFLFG